MPIRPPTAERHTGNGQPTADAPATAKARYKPRAEFDEYDKFIHSPAWTRFARLHKVFNPQCQVIDAYGQRCMNPAQETHHIDGGRTNPARRLDPSNTVSICHAHHSKQDGETLDSNRDFAPTRWRHGLALVEYKHNRPTPLKRGEVQIGPNGVARMGS